MGNCKRCAGEVFERFNRCNEMIQWFTPAVAQRSVPSSFSGGDAERMSFLVVFRFGIDDAKGKYGIEI
jgi:hypothetical protein